MISIAGRWAALMARRLPWMLMPPACRGCGALLEPLAPQTLAFPYLCNRCHDGLPWLPYPAPAETFDALDRVWAPWQYVDPVQRWIWEYKYQRRDGWARGMAHLTAQALAGGMPLADYTHIAPVPLHRRRFRWRGFNQSLLLAHQWRRALGRLNLPRPPLQAGLLLRTRHTRPQMELDAGDRKDNVRGAFAAAPRYGAALAGAQVLLVDDVMTTGSTLRECAAVLKDAGATRVEALVLARA